MTKKTNWQTFFDAHAPEYMDNVFTKNTHEEIVFLKEVLSLPEGSWVLDLGCGTGRHAVALAEKGYQIVGIDLSEGMLRQAQYAARERAVSLHLIQADATRFSTASWFDAAICLCEGAFGLLNIQDDPDTHDRRILENLYASLKPGGQLILNALNGLAMIRRFSQDDVNQGKFDPHTITETHSMDWETPDGLRSVSVRECGYLQKDLVHLIQSIGFQITHVYGGTAGNWGRRPIELDEMEMMVIALRPSK